MAGFAPVGASAITVVDSPAGQSPLITNLPIVANTETSFTFPDGTRQYQLKLRESSTLQIAFIATETNTTYLTVPKFCFYGESGLTTTALTIYLLSSVVGTVEILSWT